MSRRKCLWLGHPIPDKTVPASEPGIFEERSYRMSVDSFFYLVGV
jgi:hypothetical protein